jgi:hypothetical protein
VLVECRRCNSSCEAFAPIAIRTIYILRKKQWKAKIKAQQLRKTFGLTTNTTMENSHFPEPVWKRVLEGTFSGDPLERTSKKVHISQNHLT